MTSATLSPSSILISAGYGKREGKKGIECKFFIDKKAYIW
jgi:hypothetical protein